MRMHKNDQALLAAFIVLALELLPGARAFAQGYCADNDYGEWLLAHPEFQGAIRPLPTDSLDVSLQWQGLPTPDSIPAILDGWRASGRVLVVVHTVGKVVHREVGEVQVERTWAALRAGREPSIPPSEASRQFTRALEQLFTTVVFRAGMRDGMVVPSVSCVQYGIGPNRAG